MRPVTDHSVSCDFAHCAPPTPSHPDRLRKKGTTRACFQAWLWQVVSQPRGRLSIWLRARGPTGSPAAARAAAQPALSAGGFTMTVSSRHILEQSSSLSALGRVLLTT